MQHVNYIFMMTWLLLLLGTTAGYAQLTKEQREERQELLKMSEADLGQKASKEARKEAKRLMKEGWQAAPGTPSLDKQLDKAYMMKVTIGRDMFPQWIMGDATGVGMNYDAAKMQALSLAKQNLAGDIKTEVVAVVENSVENVQLGADEAVTVEKTISAGKMLISEKIGRMVPVMEIYRVLPNKKKEVRVVIAYNAQMAKEAAKQAVRGELEKEGEDLVKKVDELIGW